MKIAMLLPLLPLHAAAQETYKKPVIAGIAEVAKIAEVTKIAKYAEVTKIGDLTKPVFLDSAEVTRLDSAEVTKYAPNLGLGYAGECGTPNPSGLECLHEWKGQRWGKDTLDKHCGKDIDFPYHINCQACEWCKSEVTKPVIDCTHKKCAEWTCKNWCHCYEEKFDYIYAIEKCDGEDTCNCGELDNAPKEDWKEIYYLSQCRGVGYETFKEGQIAFMKGMVDMYKYQPDCAALLKERGDVNAATTKFAEVVRVAEDARLAEKN